jgi:mitochondrial-processing peptidase subunit alpha
MQCVTSRDCIMYCIDVLRENIEPAMDILADCVLNPLLPAEEVEEALAVVQYQHLELPSPVLSRDAVNRAAYLGSPLGNHHFYPIDSIKDFNVARIHNFRKQFLVGEKCILAGAGIDHQLFLSMAQKRFYNLPSSATDGGAASLKPSKYTGGLILDQRELKDNEFMRIAVAFEIGGYHDTDLVPACVLQTLLGGGSSFSAGGPGKGMYTRLYTEALNRYSWVEAAESFVTLTSESGLFGIDGACHTDRLPHMTQLFIDHIAGLQSVPVSDIELCRAKNMLKSLLLMQLESRLVLCEDIARQYAQYGFRESPAAVCKKVDDVTKEDIMRVAKRMMASDPAIGVVGCDLSQMPPYELIKSYASSLRVPGKV